MAGISRFLSEKNTKPKHSRALALGPTHVSLEATQGQEERAPGSHLKVQLRTNGFSGELSHEP